MKRFLAALLLILTFGAACRDAGPPASSRPSTFEGMPRVAQVFAEFLPLTHFVRMVRGIILRGAELGEVRNEIWPLVAFFVVVMTAAIMRFQKRLD